MRYFLFFIGMNLIFILETNNISYGQASVSQNYVMVNTVKEAGITTQGLVNGVPIATQGKAQTINYLDGLGRIFQSVVTQGSATQHDLVTNVEYDAIGREIKNYLPYADPGTSSFGSYKSQWVSAQPAFYNGSLPNVDVDNAPYSVVIPEASTISRNLAQGFPGTVWQPSVSNPYDPTTHSEQFQYVNNSAGDNIRIFNFDPLGNITTSGFYGAGQIYVNWTTDEQQQTVKEFKDKSGNTVLKRVIVSGDSLQTYYIYDNMEKLRAVIQPEGTNVLITNNWVFPAGFIGNWMFLYRYDERGRVVMKKVPGADSVNIIYDQWDRVVLTQDGNMRLAHNYLFTKYDQLNRPIISGQINDTRTLSLLSAAVAASTGRSETVNTSATQGYTLNNTFPSSASYTLTVYTTTHYDNYANLPTAWASGYNFVNEDGIATENTYLVGKIIATQANILGTSNYNRSVNYYDDRYRLTQSTQDNATGKQDRVTRILSFDGKVTNDYHTHYSNFFTTPLVTKEVYTYDPVDRLLTLTHQTGSQEVVTINQSTYNEVGQLLNKKIHQSPSHPNSLQKLDYYYNIRGWLNSVNRPLTAESGYEESDLFSEEMHYQTHQMPSAVNQFNGNIAETVWKNGYDETLEGYYYNYDQANRMTVSFYGYIYFNGYGPTWSLEKRYNEADITYDHNGNLTGLTRYLGDYDKIDFLGYKNYNGNQLGRVDDYAGPNIPVGFQDRDNGTGYDYTYDMSGNLISDYNKAVSSITYNYLNLPNVVTITGKGTINYLYDAAGNKLKKTTVDQTVVPTKTTVYTYAGDYVYRNGGTVDTLEFVTMPEGRLRPVRIDTTQAISIANLKYIYDYFIKDHLGSVRSVLTTEQETDMYAATMETANATKENALFYNVSSTATNVPPGFTNDPNNKMASKLNGNIAVNGNKRVGPSIILKVMTGDTISVSANGWYAGMAQPPATGVTAIANDLLPILTAGIGGENGGKAGSIPTTFSGPLISNDVATMVNTDISSYMTNRPKAFLNWMVVGEDYIAATASTNHVGTVQMPMCNAGDTMKQMVGLNRLVCRRNGWLYVYVSNESNQDVYFDNLTVVLTHGPLVEQKDYYAFGMQNPALSTQAIKYQYKNNRYTYTGKELQSQEFVDGSGLYEYDFGARFYDPVIARWNTKDPLSENSRSSSLYMFTFDNPTRFIDRDGMSADDFVKDKKGNIRWDNDATSSATTKAGETYLGQTLTFKFNSYIDAKSWDGPGGKGPAGDKLTSRITVRGDKNGKGELTSITATKSVQIGKTPIGTARDFYPGLGSDQNKFSASATGVGININFEQHASVSPIEETGLKVMGYNIVNVAQKLEINISQQGNVTVSAATDLFPSATLSANGGSIMQYNQPSFDANFRAPVVGTTSGGTVTGGTIQDFSYKPAMWFERL